MLGRFILGSSTVIIKVLSVALRASLESFSPLVPA